MRFIVQFTHRHHRQRRVVDMIVASTCDAVATAAVISPHAQVVDNHHYYDAY